VAGIVSLQIPKVQTAIASRLLSDVRSKMDGDITFGAIKILPFNTLIIQDILVSDAHPYEESFFEPQDTAFYFENIVASFSLRSLFDPNGIRLRKLTVTGGLVTSVMEGYKQPNFQRIFNTKPANYFNPHAAESTFHLSVRKINIRDMRIRLLNTIPDKKSLKDHGIHWKDMEARGNIKIKDFSLTGVNMQGTLVDLQVEEKSGYRMLHAEGMVKFTQGHAAVREFRMVDPWTNLYLPSFDMLFQRPSDMQYYTDKVRMTFEYKLSRTSDEQFQDDPKFKNFDGTRRFTSDQNRHFKGIIAKDAIKSSLSVEEIEQLCNNIKSVRLADTTYRMSSDTALTSFINWSRSLYPKAKNLILVFGDHGGGWGLKSDGKYDFTKAINYDDNVEDSYLTAKDVQNGILKSKDQRVKLIYTDACLMAVHENFESYAKVTDYALSAVELTPSRGGNYYVMLDNINDTTGDDESLNNACKSYIDYLNTSWWTEEGYCDLGIYDLRKNGALTTVCKSIAENLVECWNNAEPITPEASLREWKHYIRSAVSRCELYITIVGTGIKEMYIPTVIKTYLSTDGIKPDKKGKYDGEALLNWVLGDSESLTIVANNYPDEILELEEILEHYSSQEYCIADFLKVLNESLKKGGLSDDKNPFIALESNYISALKDMSYINCTKKTSETDYAYRHCGPGIFLYTFNPDSYGKVANPQHFIFKDLKLEDAISYYENSDFNKATSWISFLKLNDVSPSLVKNPTRETNNKLK